MKAVIPLLGRGVPEHGGALCMERVFQAAMMLSIRLWKPRRQSSASALAQISHGRIEDGDVLVMGEKLKKTVL